MSAVEGIARAAEARAIARVAARMREALPGVAVTETADGVTLSGRGLLERAWDDAALRWVAEVVR